MFDINDYKTIRLKNTFKTEGLKDLLKENVNKSNHIFTIDHFLNKKKLDNKEKEFTGEMSDIPEEVFLNIGKYLYEKDMGN